MSDRDRQDFATALAREYIEPKLLQSRGKELELAKEKAIEELERDFRDGVQFDLFGERQKQLTEEEVEDIKNYINQLSGRATANELLN